MKIKVYKKKIVIFTPNWKTTFTYSFVREDDEKLHKWIAPDGSSIHANAKYDILPKATTEAVKCLLIWVKQKHCIHNEVQSEDYKWTVCSKCHISMSYEGKKFF